jgi:hypothetical protein
MNTCLLRWLIILYLQSSMEDRNKCMFWRSWASLMLKESARRRTFNEFMNEYCDSLECKKGSHSVSLNAICGEVRFIFEKRFDALRVDGNLIFDTYGR